MRSEPRKSKRASKQRSPQSPTQRRSATQSSALPPSRGFVEPAEATAKARSPQSSPSPARRLAHQILVTLEESGGLADELLHEGLERLRLDARDRRLCTELTYGVLRRQATLDWRLAHVSSRPLQALDVPVRCALRLGAYQLLYLDKVPPSAAVNDSVSLAAGPPRAGSRAGSPDVSRVRGFANAVLRGLLRTPAPTPPDPAEDPVRSLAIRCSCPEWLVWRWLARHGDRGCEDLCKATLAVPPLTLRVNRLKTTREALLEAFSRAGVEAAPTALSPAGVTVVKSGAITDLPLYREGGFYVEDEAAQLVPPLLAPRAGERVLDACAAPGGKATHLAELMENRGEIVAVDRSAARLETVRANAARLGVDIIRTVAHDWRAPSPGPGEPALREGAFDCVLVDAPCSALGVLKRHPEAKWQKQAEDLSGHQARQLEILDRAAALLRPGGRLVYSTCSTEPEENEHVTAQFCASHAAFQQESVEPWLPEGRPTLLTGDGSLSTLSLMPSMDAFFACRLRKGARS